jgi:hypothetical protein
VRDKREACHDDEEANSDTSHELSRNLVFGWILL